jgi:hypothetical protein
VGSKGHESLINFYSHRSPTSPLELALRGGGGGDGAAPPHPQAWVWEGMRDRRKVADKGGYKKKIEKFNNNITY